MIWLAWALAAPVSSLPSRPAVDDVPTPTVPAEVKGLRSLLSAHHVEDLPTARLVEVKGGLEALRWLAANEPRLVVRVRALDRLSALVPDATLCRAAADAEAPGPLRAAGMRCLARLDVQDQASVELVRDALGDPDPRVRVAATRAAAVIERSTSE